MEFVIFGLIVVGVVFVAPLALVVAHYRMRTRLMILESALAEQQSRVQELSNTVAELRREGVRTEQRAPTAADAQPARPEPRPADHPEPTIAPPPGGLTQPRPAVEPSAPRAPQAPAPAPAAPPAPARPPVVHQPAVVRPVPSLSEPARPPVPRPAAAAPPPRAAAPAAGASVTTAARPGAGGSGAAPPPRPPRPEARGFDWESLVGVKLFSAIAGIALVIAAILFLGYSIQHGWLQPPVRVLIGVAVAVGLLVVCELKAARSYPATANALDAAAIGILFATFFAAHALWDLIPALATFGLLAAVTALAVLLSIRRESLFIAVLGLLGGFATPALLSTGENRPVPLFAYLVLLNVGLAWVAHRQVWPVLTALTVVLTTAYQWIWVFKFLSVSELSLAMGIFAVFPVVSVASLMFGRAGLLRARGAEDETFERATMVSAALPLLFVTYIAALPAYGARADLLFAFLLLLDVGLLSVAIALRRGLLHAIGALATPLVWGVWLSSSYDPDARTLVLAFVGAFVALYGLAPAIAGRFGRTLNARGDDAVYAAPALLFVFPVIAAIDPASEQPWPLFAPLLALVSFCAWRAAALRRGLVFFIASFFAVAAQAVWSAVHLDTARLAQAVVLYGAFGVLTAAVPVLARRHGRALEPKGGSGVVLIASLALLLFIAGGSVAPAALWALALLLTILNAGIFVESASSRIPLVSQIGSVLSWIVLAAWWLDAAGAVGTLPSLAVLTFLTLITLGGHAWAAQADRASGPRGRTSGLYLGLIGHFFLFFIATNREWALPALPIFGVLAVITVATSVAAALVRTPLLHVAGVGASALVIAGWTATTAVMPFTLAGIAASAVLSLFTFAWISLERRVSPNGLSREAAGVSLAGGGLPAVLASAARVPPPFAAILIAHGANTAALLALATASGWRWTSVGTVALAWLALQPYQSAANLAVNWPHLLVLASVFYALFTAYALVAGPRQPARREPWMVALAAAAITFFALRNAFEAGGLQWIIGIVPVVQGLVTAILLRTLLRIERGGARDETRLVLVAGAALAFVTVAIPLQLEHQWITIGWALEGAALAWLYTRVPHRGVLIVSASLLAVVFVRLSINPAIWTYEPRSAVRIFNWYLYTYLVAAVAMIAAGRLLARTHDRLASWLPRLSHLLPAGAVVLLFILLNIEIADYYSMGPGITFRFGVTLSQDLTYTIGWLLFGMLLLAAGIVLKTRPARVAAVALIAVTTFKCFLYDLRSLEGLYRVGSFVGLAVALALVSLALQKFVLTKPQEAR